MLRAMAAAGAVGAAGGLAACSQAKPKAVPSDRVPQGVEPVTVRVVDNAYEPAEVEIAAGGAVRWVFDGPGEHDVVAGDGSFVSELVSSGEYVHVFRDPGEFPYDCSIHPEMVGSVLVR